MTLSEEKITELIRQNGGIAKTRDFLASGIHPRVIYRMRDDGRLECLARGLYKLAEQRLDEPDMATVCKKIPNGIVCLTSALSIHQLTTEIPHAIHIALRRGSKKPRIEYPPVQFYWMSGSAFEEGIENEEIASVEVPVYCAEKTLADCFKYRNKLGMDVVLEALKFYRERYRFDGNKIMYYAKICRVTNIIRPYLEASL